MEACLSSNRREDGAAVAAQAFSVLEGLLDVQLQRAMGGVRFGTVRTDLCLGSFRSFLFLLPSSGEGVHTRKCLSRTVTLFLHYYLVSFGPWMMTANLGVRKSEEKICRKETRVLFFESLLFRSTKTIDGNGPCFASKVVNFD